jgi:mannose-6-phosphate isomerase-like protein (cupin superfamily)
MIFKKENLKKALDELGKNGIKLAVVKKYKTEKDFTEKVWEWSLEEKIPVIETGGTDNIEFAFFKNGNAEDRHYHENATEIYTVLEGVMTIVVADEKFEIKAGSSAYVKPKVVHEVLGDTEFYAQVIVSNIQDGDKIIVE